MKEQTKTTFFFHQTEGTVKMTVCGVLTSEKTMRIGVAYCSKKDQFVKKLGRAKAEGRARSKRHCEDIIMVSKGSVIKDFLKRSEKALIKTAKETLSIKKYEEWGAWYEGFKEKRKEKQQMRLKSELTSV